MVFILKRNFNHFKKRLYLSLLQLMKLIMLSTVYCLLSTEYRYTKFQQVSRNKFLHLE